MPVFTPAQLAAWTGGRWTAEPAVPLTGFHFDSRQLGAGAVFVAIRTDKRDGRDFFAGAQAAGAAAALVSCIDRAIPLPQLVVRDPLAAWQAIAREHRRAFRRPVVGISGSAGKTSTKDLLALLLGGAGRGVLATEGNLNNHLGVPLMLTRLDPARHTFAVIEAGIGGPGEMAPLAAMIEPDVALITLIAAAHTEALGGLAGVAREKAVLPAAVRRGGLAIFSAETAAYPPFQHLTARTCVVQRPDGNPAAGAGRVVFSVAHRADGTALTVTRPGAPSESYFLRRVSEGQAQNAVLAICAATELGVTPAEIQSRLAGWQAARWRGEIRREQGRLLYLDCYNANPASMADALATFADIAPAGEPRLYVLGGMEELGSDAAAAHHALGQSLALGPQDHVFVIGTHAAEVAAGLHAGGAGERQVHLVTVLEPAAAAVAEWHGAIFVKGSRRYQLEKVLEVPTSPQLPC